jgi:adenosylmethionine-8-amino-7-oxononanoate aminotransferase
MSSTNQPSNTAALQASANAHLWMAMSNMDKFHHDKPAPIMVRGEGCYLWDSNGKRYLDGISSLFTVQLGHGRTDLAEAAAKQAAELAYFPVWNSATPPAIELAEKLASLAPANLNKVFFTTGGAEANESAWKLARQYFRLTGHPGKYKAISREIAYHGTAMGALAMTQLDPYKEHFGPLVPGVAKVPNTNFYRAEVHGDDEAAFGRWAADQIEAAILAEGPETVALVILEPVQNAGGCFVPPPGYAKRVREICDTYNVLLVCDEVICAFGRLGHYFSSERYGFEPDLISCAKGMTSAYAPIGASIISDRLMEPFLRDNNIFAHGYTFAGHPVSAAVALANLAAFEREGILEHVRSQEGNFRATLETLCDLPIVGDIRGDGFFYGIEMVKDKTTKETFTAEECDRLIDGYLSTELFDRGLICRSDDRGDPVIQVAPPLISTQAQFDEMTAIIREVLDGALERI